MPVYRGARSAQMVALILAASCLGLASAQAAPNTKPSKVSGDLAAPAGARFFTINQVLAKRTEPHSANSSAPFAHWRLRLAAIAPGSLSDGAHEAAPYDLPAPSKEPFGMETFRAPEGQLWAKWRAVEAETATELKLLDNCRAASNCTPAATRLLAMADKARTHAGVGRLKAVNGAVNAAIRYESDAAQHGQADRWTTPLASLATGRGDCEDYAIAKYFVLKRAGMADQDLRIMLVRDLTARQDHAALAVREGERWLVLDNRSLAPAEDRELRHFVPLFSLNQTGVKLFAAPYAAREGEADDTAGRNAAFSDWTLRGSTDAIAPAAAGDDGAVIAP